jgi:hypothetical protein
MFDFPQLGISESAKELMSQYRKLDRGHRPKFHTFAIPNSFKFSPEATNLLDHKIFISTWKSLLTLFHKLRKGLIPDVYVNTRYTLQATNKDVNSKY